MPCKYFPNKAKIVEKINNNTQNFCFTVRTCYLSKRFEELCLIIALELLPSLKYV